MSPTPHIPLGPFELIEPIGRGGMGEVWRGIHSEQRVAVAVKVVTAERSQHQRYRSAFRSEVRAAARLHHPSIVTVYDYGEVGEESSLCSRGRLVAGGPFLTMELVNGGSLADLRYPISWLALRQIIVQLLDALAHAHARGVIHRDLKPSNVLFHVDDKLRGVKLVDFGIAHALDAQTRTGKDRQTPGEIEPIAGTPHYMAPEQFHGYWRDYGPWTDLYSLGCVVFELATGHTPFDGDGFFAIAMEHLNAPLPKLNASDSYPPGFEGWIHRLLEKNPQQRFQRAADATWSFTALGSEFVSNNQMELGFLLKPDPLEQSTTVSSTTLTPPTYSSERETESTATTVADTVWPETQPPSRGDQIQTPFPHPAVSLPPLPVSWRRPKPSTGSAQLVGASLGLYGLRSIELVNRDHERDMIWETLRKARQTQRPHLAYLHGPAGVGKSRLTQWVSQRAHELGLATMLKATHSPMKVLSDGLAGMLARHFRCVGLRREEALKRVERQLRQQGIEEIYESHALSQVMTGAVGEESPDSPGRIQFEKPSQRYVVIQRLIHRLAQQRPVLLWFDDVQWGSDALSFTQYLFEKGPLLPCPVLLLLTARDESLAEQPIEMSQIDALLKRQEAIRLTVGPLSHDHHAELVRDLLHLETRLAEQVETRTGGNPLFAIQLVGDWVRRNVLELGTGGFTLKAGECAQLPDDLHQVWLKRLQTLVARLRRQPDEPSDTLTDASEWIALELAATLGNSIDEGEWNAICQNAGISIPHNLVDSLLSNHLLISEDEARFSFVHNMLRESLERCARERGRWQAHNELCVTILKQRYPLSHRGLLERLGRHHFEAGRFETALELLLSAVDEVSGIYSQAELSALLDYREEITDHLDADDRERPRLETEVCRARLLVTEGQHAKARQMAEPIEIVARKRRWFGILADALWVKATEALIMGESESAVRWFEEAHQCYQQTGNGGGTIRCLNGLGVLARTRCRYDEATELLNESLQRAKQQHQHRLRLRCLDELAIVALDQGDLTTAERIHQEALSLSMQMGFKTIEASCRIGLAEIARFNGNLDAAESGYRKAQQAYDCVGIVSPVIQLNLGLVLLQRGEYSDAQRIFSSLIDTYQPSGHKWLVSGAHAANLPCLAIAGDWRAWDDSFRLLRSLLDETQFVIPDTAWALQHAGVLARDAGQHDRARQAFEAAREHWIALGRESEVASVEQQMRDLRG